MSGIREQIDERFKQARLQRDERTKNVIGMIRAKVLEELKSGKGVEESDALWQQMLGTYAKQLRKTIDEYEKIGERGAEALPDLRFELEFCTAFLPSKLDEAATEALVRRIAAEQGISDPKLSGKLSGAVMKAHRDEVDGDTLKKVVAKVLGG